jgi:succinate dehydrogenase/fumarate reductase flavoprotein subunit
MVRADDLGALARAIGVPPDTFTDTVERFNVHAKAGVDPDFGRGAHDYDRWIGNHEAPDPNLAPLETPPYYAVQVLAGCLGTKGGPRTDRDARVLRGDGGTIEGLFAAGNAAASPFGIGTPGGGGTIGPALVFGTRAGEAAAR